MPTDDESSHDDPTGPEFREQTIQGPLGVYDDAMEAPGESPWSPVHMLNDMGPATVARVEDDFGEESHVHVQRAVERALNQGEESDVED